MPQSKADDSANSAQLHTLTGTVVKRGWTKTYESWNAGGSEYFVLLVADLENMPGPQTAQGGVILRPSQAVPFSQFERVVGTELICTGQFVNGEPFIPPDNDDLQHPLPVTNPITGELEHPIRGSGFEVHSLAPVNSCP